MPEAIFGPYTNGISYVHADPFRIHRLLTSLLPAEVANRLLDEGTPDSMDRFLGAVCQVFAIQAFDPATGQGATEDAVIDVWNAWQDFCAEKKTTPGTTPTSTTVSPEPRLPAWAHQSVSAS